MNKMVGTFYIEWEQGEFADSIKIAEHIKNKIEEIEFDIPVKSIYFSEPEKEGE